MNKSHVRGQIDRMERSAAYLKTEDDTLDEGFLMEQAATSMEALLKENERLRADNIRVRGVLQVLNPEALAIADAVKAPAVPESSVLTQHTDPDKSFS